MYSIDMEFRYYSIPAIKQFIQAHGLAIHKKMGQNFLVNAGVVQTIIDNAKIRKSDICFEIGCGLGSVTSRLIKSGASVIGFELDKAYATHLRTIFADYTNFSLVEGDFLKTSGEVIDTTRADKEGRILYFGNLPYYITTPILEHIFTNRYRFDALYFMMQREVANRITASPGTKEYGSLSIFCNYFSQPRIISRVSASSFYPKPNVDSAVLSFTRKRDAVTADNEDLFLRLARSLFINRRKQIRKNLGLSPFLTPIEKGHVSAALEACSISPQVRGETLSVEMVLSMANQLHSLSKYDTTT
jgi:16S rRNA (adenine1518-N6/adenine1519-N6)-dimethyltransferase